MIQFQEYLQSDYPGFASFINIIIKPIFGDNFKAVENIDDMIDCLNDDPDELECYDEIEKADANLKKLAKESGLERILKLGTIKVQGGIRPIYVYDITVSKHRLLSRNRKGIQQLISRTLSNQSGAFMLFHYEDAKWEWRFSYKFVGKDQNDSTNSKRFTYLFGKNQVCKTAAQRFTNLLNKKCEIAIDDITEAFSVEALSKEFFNTYKSHYERFCQFIYDNKYDCRFFGEEFSKWEDKTIRDYVKKLLGRIVFLHFLQKKGWMGVPADKQWGEGDLKFMMNLYDSCNDKQKANYLDEVLEPMFEDINTKRIEDLAGNWSQSYIVAEEKRDIKIPYLNGGLFEREATDTPKSVFPADYFAKLLDFFNQYNFTIDENDPNDAEVGIDPEMLGRIFENLLEDNKDKGAFYTPKEIVQYMCRESLIAYLQTDAEDITKESLRQFVLTHEVGELRPADVFKVDKKLREVKICDPAIGSGAFPMGLLKELFECRMAIEGSDEGKTPSEIKKDIIQNSIYGVDIEKGAVDIARLRFWLSLIIDEQTPNALPNMDFKIMRGNSLLEQYNGFDLSTIMHSKKKVESHVQMTLFEDDVDVLRRQVIGLRRAYFRETNKVEKKKLRQRMREMVQQQINALSYNIDLSGIDIADNSDFFLWHTWYSDVFENGGFDIVIANPPYIRVQNLDYKTIDILKKIYKVAFKRLDISLCFIELAHKLCKQKHGSICYITSNQFLTTEYGKEMRSFILNRKSLTNCVDLADLPIFSDALTYVSIFSFQINTQSTFFKYYHSNTMDDVKRMQYPNIKEIDYATLSSDNWNLKGNEKNKLFEKICRENKKLEDIGHCNAGLITGCDKVLMFKDSDLDSLPFEKDILLPVLRAENCSKYNASEPSKFVIYPYSQKDGKTKVLSEEELIEKYPLAYSYLLQNKELLLNRKDSRKTIGEKSAWYGLVRFGRLDMYEQPKIISPGEVLDHKFCIDYSHSGFSCARVFAITVEKEFDIKYVLALLNSSFMKAFIQSIASLKNGGYYQYSANILNRCPIPTPTDEQKNVIVKQVETIMNMKKKGEDTSALESSIDTFVYQLYGLTEDEVKIIEQS